jgi:hypothetical protein
MKGNVHDQKASGFVAFTCLASTAALAGPIENYSPVTSQRLENPEPGNWMLYRRNIGGNAADGNVRRILLRDWSPLIFRRSFAAAYLPCRSTLSFSFWFMS